MPISQTNESAAEHSGSFVCPNASCGRIFAKPLRVTDFQRESAEPYDACPYCLTEVTADNYRSVLNVAAEEETMGQDGSPGQVAVLGSSVDCQKHFGYLSERSPKEKIPEECLTCKDIVHCMLKKTMD